MSAPDPRRTAFLTEMGVGPQWLLRAAPEIVAEVEDEPAAPPEPATPVLAAPPETASSGFDSAWEDGPAVPATDEEIARMGWPELKAAVAACTRCGLCGPGRAPVQGSGNQTPRWVVVSGAPERADVGARRLFSGDSGTLLGNMLAAVALSREQDVYVSSVVKGFPSTPEGAARAASEQEVAACRPYVARELALTGSPLVLAVGAVAVNGLLKRPSDSTLDTARGMAHRLDAATLVASHHPGYLLRDGAAKADAWADLCLARSLDGRGD